jgi:predicted flap endonuclease-1-like 5' DNA nuclease
MSILFYVLAFLACIGTAAGGAWAMRWHMERTREVPDHEDPRDTKIRELLAQTRLAQNDMRRNRQAAEASQEHVQLAHERIEELAARCEKLAASGDDTRTELGEANADRDLLRDKLSIANRQLDSLKQRVQELELELRVANDADMLEPRQAQEDGAETGDDLDTIEMPKVDDTAPSLLHSLTTELERWKRHCRVLGDELKLQRERLAQMGQSTDSDENPFDSIDELTDIRGIGNAIARKLHQLGIYRYKELASLTEDDLERAHMLMPDFSRRMRRDRWQEQARELHRDKYREPL